MKRLTSIAIAALCTCSSFADHHEWVSMFNGKTLEGWTQKNGTATYHVENKTIVGHTSPGSPNSFLCSVKEYGNFEFEFEVRVHGELNSGVQIRSQTDDQEGHSIYNSGRVNGPQVEIEAGGEEGAEAGYVYGEASGGWMTPPERLIPHKHFKDGEWNQFRIVANGARIQTFINGQKIEDLVDEEKFKSHPKGFIGLQVHGIGDSSATLDVAWRNLRIRELQ